MASTPTQTEQIVRPENENLFSIPVTYTFCFSFFIFFFPCSSYTFSFFIYFAFTLLIYINLKKMTLTSYLEFQLFNKCSKLLWLQIFVQIFQAIFIHLRFKNKKFTTRIILFPITENNCWKINNTYFDKKSRYRSWS